jgi:hypothetical protein
VPGGDEVSGELRRDEMSGDDGISGGEEISGELQGDGPSNTAEGTSLYPRVVEGPSERRGRNTHRISGETPIFRRVRSAIVVYGSLPTDGDPNLSSNLFTCVRSTVRRHHWRTSVRRPLADGGGETAVADSVTSSRRDRLSPRRLDAATDLGSDTADGEDTVFPVNSITPHLVSDERHPPFQVDLPPRLYRFTGNPVCVSRHGE